MDFFTGLCVLNVLSGEAKTHVDRTSVHFKQLTDEQITYYLNKEQPFDCAGSFKSEGMGIALFNNIDSRDPNALVGLPIIGLCDLFTAFGVDLLTLEN